MRLPRLRDPECFNSRAHGARDRTGSRYGGGWGRFNSRAHGARDVPALLVARIGAVSIHARTGRATHGLLLPCWGCGFNSRAHGARDRAVTMAETTTVFQFTRARGARPCCPRRPRRTRSFNSRAHGARDVRRDGQATHRLRFNSRAHGARDWAENRYMLYHNGFNSRAHGARDTSAPPPCSPKLCFNSRAHGARDHRPGIPLGLRTVSIHARTGRATLDPPAGVPRGRVSIHARTGRATAYWSLRERGFTFQFTRARGARLNLRLPGGGRTVSIHARTGRATGRWFYWAIKRLFQFTRARGARRTRRDAQPRALDVSIHARTGRATRPTASPPSPPIRFNSRAHGARDMTSPSFRTCRCGFNSRAHGARDLLRRRLVRALDVSIHARTGRATHAMFVASSSQSGFNSRAHGARDGLNRHYSHFSTFQFTRARGARHAVDKLREAMSNVSIHARTGRATLLHVVIEDFTEFQFTRARGARPLPLPPGIRQASFNSRAHGARDLGRPPEEEDLPVSIHARTGRATICPDGRRSRPRFQFTRARGARPMPLDKSVKGHRVVRRT